MQATKVNAGHSTFKTPECFKGGECAHCGLTLRDYAGVRIGPRLFCNFDHYVKYKEKVS